MSAAAVGSGCGMPPADLQGRQGRVRAQAETPRADADGVTVHQDQREGGGVERG